jgi:hypothetical protein
MIREFSKVVCILLIAVGSIAAAIAWIDDRPNEISWTFRIAGPLIAIVAFLGFLVVHFRRDQAPDYLYRTVGKYFDRGGLCFSFIASNVNGICFLNLFFQNRYEKPCIGKILLRPARGFLENRKMEAIQFQVECEAGAFGVTRLPLPIAEAMQGKRQAFDVGASVEYPKGRGRMLRFRDGIVIRDNTDFRNSFRETATVIAAMHGHLVHYKPAKFTMMLPTNVEESAPAELIPETEIFWTLNDPPFETPSLEDGIRSSVAYEP